MMHDRICILLIDDKPFGNIVGAPPALPTAYESWFDFRWLAKPEECREFRDLSWLVAENDPSRLGRDGWLPEILAIDYMLMEVPKTVQERANKSGFDATAFSPLLALRTTASKWKDAIVNKKIPRRGSANEYWGCFAGGLILATFADHPCAPVTITAWNPSSGPSASPDTVYFEWLMATQSGGLLEGTGQGSKGVTWEGIIASGVERLRKRIEELARCGIVTVDLKELANLAAGAHQSVVTFTSRYGTRRLPVSGLFIDNPTAANGWARDLFRGLVSPGNWQEFGVAEKHANELLDTYDNEEFVWKRIKLSNLLRWKEKGISIDESDLESLKQEFDADIEVVTNKQGNCKITGKIQNHVCDIRYLQLEDWVRKCTAFIVVLKLLKRFCENWKQGMPYEEISPGEVYLALCPVARNPIILPFSYRSGRNTKADMPLRNVGFTVEDVLEGGGLDAADRTLFKHLAATLGIGGEYLKRYPKAKQIVEGI